MELHGLQKAQAHSSAPISVSMVVALRLQTLNGLRGEIIGNGPGTICEASECRKNYMSRREASMTSS